MSRRKSFLKQPVTVSKPNDTGSSGVNGYTFFIFDHTVLKKEEDDLKDAIIYFFPNTDPDTQCALVGQIIGMSEFFLNAIPRSFANLFKLQKDKFVIRKRGNYTFALGGRKALPDSCLQKHIDNLIGTFLFYQGSLDALKQNLKSEFLSALSHLLGVYLPFCESFGDVVSQVFDMVPSVELPITNSQLYLHASHILQRSLLRPSVLAGAVLYRNQSLCSQLPPFITRRLLLLKSKQSHLQRARIKINYDLPQGIQLLKVYLTLKEYSTLSPRKPKSWRNKHNKNKNCVLDLNELAGDSLDISGISFLECNSGITPESEQFESFEHCQDYSEMTKSQSKQLVKCDQTSKTTGALNHKLKSESEPNKPESDTFLTASDQDSNEEKCEKTQEPETTVKSLHITKAPVRDMSLRLGSTAELHSSLQDISSDSESQSADEHITLNQSPPVGENDARIDIEVQVEVKPHMPVEVESLTDEVSDALVQSDILEVNADVQIGDDLDTHPGDDPDVHSRDGLDVHHSGSPDAHLRDGPETHPGNDPEANPSNELDVPPGDGSNVYPGDSPDVHSGDGLDVHHSDSPDAHLGDGLETHPGDDPETNPSNKLDVHPGDGSDVHPDDGPDVHSVDGIDILSVDGQDVQLGDGQDVQLGDGPDVYPGDGLNIHPVVGLDVHPGDGPDMHPSDSPDVNPDDGPDVHPSDGTVVHTGDGPEVCVVDGQDVHHGYGQDADPGNDPDAHSGNNQVVHSNEKIQEDIISSNKSDTNISSMLLKKESKTQSDNMQEDKTQSTDSDHKSSTQNQSPIKKELSDTLSSDDLSMGESSIDPPEIKKRARQLLKLSQQTIEEVKSTDDFVTSEIQIISEAVDITDESNTKSSDKSKSKKIFKNVISDTSDIRNRDRTSSENKSLNIKKLTMEKKYAITNTSHVIDNKFDDSGLGHSSDFQNHGIAVVDSNLIPVTLDVITDGDENKLLKSSGSSITSDEANSHNAETFGAVSTNESLASIDSSSPTLSHKKSVTFSQIDKSTSENGQKHSPVAVKNTTSENEVWKPLSDDLLECVLYVQGHSDMMLLLFLDVGTLCDRKLVTNLWKSSVSHLADLDYEVKESISKANREKQNSKSNENYFYLKYDSFLKTAKGNSLSPMTSVGYDFINTVGKIHDSFSSSKTTTELLLRTHTGTCYGCHTVNNETYFQTATPAKDQGGCPSPKDPVFSLDETAADKLQTKHNQTLL